MMMLPTKKSMFPSRQFRGHTLRSIEVLLLLCVLTAPRLLGQTITATITGVITDASGAVIPGAAVTATNVNTGQSRAVKTSSSGNYQLSQLPVGTYTLSVVMTGFEKTELSGLTLQVDQVAREDIKMAVGAATETVTVQTTAPLVNAETSSVSQVIDNKKVTELPLNGRNANQLVLLAPGVTPTNATNGAGFSNYSVAGGRSSTNSTSLDGVDNNDDATTAPTVQPSVDLVQEFRVEINSYSAAFGRYAGGQIDVTTKGGTNKLHGSAFYFARNQIFDATNWSATPIAKAPFSRNQFGADLGGPIIHNKTFFFALYEGFRTTTSTTAANTVPTVLERAGNFSELLPKTQLVNPLTRAAIPGNIIPSSLINAVGQNVLNLFPLPQIAALANNFTASPASTERNDQYNARIDHQIRPSDLIWARYTYVYDKQYKGVIQAPNYLPGYGGIQPTTNHNAVLSYSHTFTPNLIDEVRFGFNRLSLLLTPDPSEVSTSTIGITGLDPLAYTVYAGTPIFSFTGYSQLGGVNFHPQYRADNTFQLVDSVTYSHGSHSMRMGADLKSYQLYQSRNSNVRGTYNFTGQYSSQAGSASSGNAAADLLFGVPANTSRLVLGNASVLFYPIQDSYAFYAQDDWKASRRATLNLGVRYEVDPPVWYKGFVGSGFNPQTGTIQLPGDVSGALDLTKPGTTFPIPIPVPITKIGTRTICDANAANFGPRVGAALRPSNDNKTVINAGFGVFFNVPQTNTSCGDPRQIYAFSETFNGTIAPGIPNLVLPNPFPTAALGAAFTPTANVPSAHHIPYVYQYNLGIQRQLSGSLVAEISYVGSTGVRLSVPLNINQAQLNTSLANTSATEAQRRPFYSLGLLNTVTDNVFEASSNYNGLLTRLEKRYTNGLSFLASYTYSKSLDDSSGSGPQNAYSLRADHGLSTTDVRHRFVFSYTYLLPFGRGGTFGKNWSAIPQALLGGYEFSGIFSAQTGFALSPTVSGDNSLTSGLLDRPNYIPGGISGCTPAANTKFNTCFFQVAPVGTFGNAARGSITGPGYQDLDFSLQKNFFIRDKNKIQFRAEAFNVLNHPSFLAPLVNASSATTFGTVTSAGPMRQLQLALRYDF